VTRDPLAVWLYGTRVAELAEDGDERMTMTWTRDAYNRWGSGARVVSQLLPITLPDQHPPPTRVRVFIDNLLPEGNARVNYALDVGLRSEDTFGLISRYGRDTAGALVFQPPDEPEPTRNGEYGPLTAEQIGQRLLEADRHAPTDPSARGVESISLTGMQPKIGLHRIDDVWQACRRGAPSTWIVKLAHPVGSVAQDVIDTEVLSLELAAAVGLGNVRAQIHDFGGVRAIAVARYDRRITPDGIIRIHQEDLAQALGINTSDPNRKFQRGNRLPSLAKAAEVLAAGGAEPYQLLRLTAFNFLIGNTDAHAKNHSFLRRDDATVELAPAYDVSMHLHHARSNELSAMDLNGKRDQDRITITDVIAEGVAWGVPGRVADRIVAATADALADALTQVDLSHYPGVPAAALDVVVDRTQAARRALGSAAPTASANSSRRDPASTRGGPRAPR
jgi:serine/threonine-protein kinase HipA